MTIVLMLAAAFIVGWAAGSRSAFSKLVMSRQNSELNINVKISGDVKNSLFDVRLNPDELGEIMQKGNRIKVIDAKKFIDKAGPVSPDKVFLIGRDGIAAELEYGKLEGSFFTINDEGLCFLTRNFPVNTQIKGIEEIIVKGDEKVLADRVSGGIFVIQGDELSYKSPGELLMLPYQRELFKVGESTRSVDGNEYKGVVYQSRNLVSILSILNAPARKIAAYSEEGDILYADADARLQINSPHGLILHDAAGQMKKPIGIVADPPASVITDVAEAILEKAEQGRKVMVVYIDGMGYEIYEKAKGKDCIPFLSSLGNPQKALTVFPPITDVTYSSMVTGKTPAYTGIRSRGDSDLKCDTVFETLSRSGKRCIVVEGNIKILKDDSATVLNIDENKDGFIDDEIFDSSLKQMKDRPDVMLVHFHSYDDLAHEYGPYSLKAMKQLQIIDGWTEKLVGNWDGDIIVTADHGLHEEGEGGNHGSFCPEDIFIPIIYSSKM
ncbi:MAG: hypothetical protein PWQ97_1105 [Tepidanaerobacteraceae bacterium]|nr:hypothetical protein [Tepidanaerobacteraceae bacterium]